MPPSRSVVLSSRPASGSTARLKSLCHLREKTDEEPRVLEPFRAGAQAAEEGRPDALEEVDGVEPRPQQPGQLAPDDQANLRLVAGEQLARGRFIAVPDAAEQGLDIDGPRPERMVLRIGRGHRLSSQRAAALTRE